jgi:hypothetical protein
MLKAEASDVSRFIESPHSRQSAQGSNGLTLESGSDIVFPMAFLSPSSLAGE